ncbi:CAP domain-containing protein [Candidatus Uhrbacteria bacterium]|nr:CAP domain-containing protein [Candidatus Uhrbacteria bacterium]
MSMTAVLLLFAIPSNALSPGVDRNVLIDATNAARKTRELRPLDANPLLTAAAQARAEELIRNAYFAHERPDGTSFATAVTASGYPFARVAENLAMDFLHESPMVNAWLESPTHRGNLLNATYEDIGIGISYGIIRGAPSTVVVQLLGVTPNTAPPVSIPMPSGMPFA